MLRKLEGLSWHARSARHWILHNGLEVDLVQLSPAALRAMAVQAACFVSDVIGQQKALPAGAALPPVNWQLIRRMGSKLPQREENALHSCLTGPAWTQDKFHRWGMTLAGTCQLCHKARGTIAHRRYRCSDWHFERGHALDPDILRWARTLPDGPAEQLARGLMALPLGLMPRPLVEE